MSSKYGRRSKIQPTPKFCYHKGPYHYRYIPCAGGPSIGPTPYVAMIVKDNQPPTREYLICGRLDKTSPTDPVYAGRLIGPDQSVWQCNFNFDCEQQIFTWAASTLDPRWPAGPWTAVTPSPYVGPRNIDTRWQTAFAPYPVTRYTGRFRVYL